VGIPQRRYPVRRVKRKVQYRDREEKNIYPEGLSPDYCATIVDGSYSALVTAYII
jgi:hypothetical protein